MQSQHSYLSSFHGAKFSKSEKQNEPDPRNEAYLRTIIINSSKSFSKGSQFKSNHIRIQYPVTRTALIRWQRFFRHMASDGNRPDHRSNFVTLSNARAYIKIWHFDLQQVRHKSREHSFRKLLVSRKRLLCYSRNKDCSSILHRSQTLSKVLF